MTFPQLFPVPPSKSPMLLYCFHSSAQPRDEWKKIFESRIDVNYTFRAHTERTDANSLKRGTSTEFLAPWAAFDVSTACKEKGLEDCFCARGHLGNLSEVVLCQLPFLLFTGQPVQWSTPILTLLPILPHDTTNLPLAEAISTSSCLPMLPPSLLYLSSDCSAPDKDFSASLKLKQKNQGTNLQRWSHRVSMSVKMVKWTCTKRGDQKNAMTRD